MKTVKTLIAILIIVAIILIGLLVYQTCSGHGLIQRIDKMEPEKTVAPFEVATQSHIYYAVLATLSTDKSVTMKGWDERVDGKWVKHDDSITLPKLLRPRISKR